ncbi:hypothetical protein ACJIZ3_008824 [Penstemon smallii]|uniref:Secreted protein n=1 Tax=Penstemon smallii TaxID=265156 RepID=A0ABD3TCI7_9LAMI
MVLRSRAWITFPRLNLRLLVGARCEHITTAHALASHFNWLCRSGSYVSMLLTEKKPFICAKFCSSISPLRKRSSVSSF